MRRNVSLAARFSECKWQAFAVVRLEDGEMTLDFLPPAELGTFCSVLESAETVSVARRH